MKISPKVEFSLLFSFFFFFLFFFFKKKKSGLGLIAISADLDGEEQ
jgi:hypothetical protein